MPSCVASLQQKRNLKLNTTSNKNPKIIWEEAIWHILPICYTALSYSSKMFLYPWGFESSNT